jgi:DNA (cytosine-5)-methyltransferase 1
MKEIQFLIIDLFCGAGGTTLGFKLANHRNPMITIGEVIACVNHDPLAIKSHHANNPSVYHFEEDITLLYGLIKNGVFLKSPQFLKLIRLVEMYRAFYPKAKVILWASLECTNFSKAKGGMPRDADSRTLAEHLEPYIVALDPDYVQIENVVEFMSWGPLDAKGKPVSRKNGKDWIRWRESICSLGYYDQWKEINSADFGALTSRNRLFGCFAKLNLPIVWPLPTHSKKPENTTLAHPLRKWEPVKKALDFSDEGNSVFNRKKPLSTKTMQRLFMGCVKHIAGGKNAFIAKAYGGDPTYQSRSLDEPSGSLTTIPNQQSIVFITKWNSNNKKHGGHPGHSIEEPAPVITTQNRLGAAFIVKGFSSHSGKSVNSGSSIEQPFPTITTQNRERLAQLTFISRYNGVNGGKHDNSKNINEPIGALGTGDNHAKISASYIIINPSWGGNSGSIEEPCHVVVARQDKVPLGLITCTGGIMAIPIYENDCEWTIKLKEFMVLYNIADIKMRMLKVPELKLIQGFPENYVLMGNQTDQKKFIGNSVHPLVPKSWGEAFSIKLFSETYLMAA